MDPVNAARHFLSRHRLDQSRIVVAISGGIDSTALLLILSRLREECRLTLVAAHVNHHLRGPASDEDERFVVSLCERLAVPLRILDGTLAPGEVRAVGVEAAARAVRYAKLIEARERLEFDSIATAHQQNDQAETVLLRVVRGGGPGSLRAIRPVREDRIIRPLLDVPRSAIETFLHAEGVAPRHDQSNDDPRFLRNRIRRVITDESLGRLAAVAAGMQKQWPVLEQQLVELEKHHATISAGETRFRSFPDDAWTRQALLHRHISRLDPEARNVTAAKLERLAGDLERIRRVSVTARVELVRARDEWVLRRRPEPAAGFDLPMTPGQPGALPGSGFTLHVERHAGPADTSIRQLIQLPPGSRPLFRVRSRRPGDRFQPLGLAGTKKLKDFLIDRKIAAELRDSLPLVTWNDEIVLVAGVEVSEKFKVTASPGDVFRVWMEGPVGEHDSDQSDVQRRGDCGADPLARR